MEVRLKQRSHDETSDIYATTSTALCSTCAGVMGQGYPLWGIHLQAAIAMHAAHRAVTELADVPAPTDTDRLFGRRLIIGVPE